MKRFYKEVSVKERSGSFEVRLDGKPMRTPLKKVLVLPSRALADAIAAEWAERQESFDPAAMLLTRLANATIDRGEEHRAGLVLNIVKYGENDLVCYRAEDAELGARQAAGFDPILDWLAETQGARLKVTTGLVPIAQPEESTAALAEAVASLGDTRLTALYASATILGSLALALAMVQERLSAREAFELSRLDEAHQAKTWGKDREAEARAARLREELEAVERFLVLSRS